MVFRFEIELIIKDSPSLKPFLSENFLVAYQKARKNILKVIKTSSIAKHTKVDIDIGGRA